MHRILFLAAEEQAWITSVSLFSLGSSQREKGGAGWLFLFFLFHSQLHICYGTDSGHSALQTRVKFQQEKHFGVSEFNNGQISDVAHTKPGLLLGYFS